MVCWNNSRCNVNDSAPNCEIDTKDHLINQFYDKQLDLIIHRLKTTGLSIKKKIFFLKHLNFPMKQFWDGIGIVSYMHTIHRSLYFSIILLCIYEGHKFEQVLFGIEFLKKIKGIVID